MERFPDLSGGLMISTIHGDMDEADLVKSEGYDEFDADGAGSTSVVDWVEYRLPDSDEIIHRSAHITVYPCMTVADISDA
jgi:hypothetical protein